ncbi:hypothetical protein CXG81DRAFT_11819 [Caulochytrium protostelioides]|uniref:Vinculin/alpha-catenin n=1 Tax=Caulochytrium protostelioides TaxID=1555241 RepID=A0A4P9X8E9_9FUNG|nr:hypothetical protein CXG81DRAFT_11819 [Caulochytrium protostelioides]|eukprot:RKP01546.1 hypothetical protein CXG81DRAFT_11819 [Caulochytrium protostelioides]
MWTTTSKEVLGPLAEATNAFTVIIGRAEESGDRLADFTQLAVVVADQIHNLIGVARQMTHSQDADEQLKRDLPAACDSVSASADQLVDAAKRLAIASSPQDMARLADAVRGILTGTSAVLHASDDAEVRKILTASNAVRTYLLRLTRLAAQEAPREQITVIAGATQQGVVLAQLCTRRVNELLHPMLQTRLRAAVEVLVKDSPLLVSGTKLALKRGTLPAFEMRNHCAHRMAAACDDIDRIIQWSEAEESSSMIGDDVFNADHVLAGLLDAQKQLLSAVVSKDTSGATAAAQRLGALQQRLLDHYHAVRPLITDPVQRAAVEQIVQRLQAQDENLVGLTRDAMQSPKGALALGAALACQAVNYQKLKERTNMALVGPFGDAIRAVGDRHAAGSALQQLCVAAKAGDVAQHATAAAAFKAQTATLLQGMKYAIEACAGRDPDHAQHLQLAHDRLDHLQTLADDVTRLTAEAPADVSCVEHMDNVLAAWETAVGEVQQLLLSPDATFTTGELFRGAQAALDHQITTLHRAVDGQQPAQAEQAVAHLLATAQQLLELGEREQGNTEDPAYQAALTQTMGAVRVLLPDLIRMTRVAQNPEARAEYTGALTATVALLHHRIKDLGAHIVQQSAPLVADEADAASDVAGADADGTSDADADATSNADAAEAATSDRTGATASLTADTPAKDASERSGETGTIAEADAATHGDGALVASGLDVIYEEAPQLLSEEEAAAAPIKAVGQELKVAVSQWRPESNPVTTSASAMASMLLALAAAHQQLFAEATPANKKQFVERAQAIVGESAVMVAAARPLATECTDLRLRKQLTTTLDRTETLCQQLKIVAAVKASDPNDRDRDQQLVACAKNLLLAFKTCLRDSEAASLRITDPRAARQFQFRKVLYRPYGQSE